MSTTNEQPKYCVNCLHYSSGECRRDMRVDLVKGTSNPVLLWCNIERAGGLEQNCGPDAKFYKPAPMLQKQGITLVEVIVSGALTAAVIWCAFRLFT